MPQSRRGSNNFFCKSMRVNGTTSRIDHCRDLEDIERLVTHRDRYYKLNTRSYWKHKTVEYRQHSGSIDFEKISNWLLFTARLTEYSLQGFELANDSLEETEKFLDENILNYIRRRTQQLAS
jgi:argonaute-like protein implicated in RNA metabolism and viral defense